MFPLRRLNLAQRVIVVVALGLALRLLDGFFLSAAPLTGWTGYAPPSFFTVRFHPVPALLIQLALVAVWAVASVLILRPAAKAAPAAARPGSPAAADGGAHEAGAPGGSA